MSAHTLAQQGIKLVESGHNYAEAVEKLSKAIESSKAPKWLLARCQAYVSLKRLENALADAVEAWYIALGRSDRESLMEVHYYRGLIYYHAEQYVNAEACFHFAQRLYDGRPVKDPHATRDLLEADGTYKDSQEVASQLSKKYLNMRDENGREINLVIKSKKPAAMFKKATTFRLMAHSHIEKYASDDPRRKLTVSLEPKREDRVGATGEIPQEATASEKTQAVEAPAGKATDGATSVKATDDASATQKGQTSPTVRFQDFQTDKSISASIFLKDINKEEVQVVFQPTRISIFPVPIPGHPAEHRLSIELMGEVVPTECTYTLTPSKLELSLKKRVPMKWARLCQGAIGGDKLLAEKLTQADAVQVDGIAASAEQEAQTEPSSQTAAEQAAAKPFVVKPNGPLAYPTSSKAGPRNWDKMEDDDEYDESKEDVNHFFKKLYSGATADQQRAMMKSFVESNGTTLSTDWNDVKSRTMETHPPDGVEAKKWDD